MREETPKRESEFLDILGTAEALNDVLQGKSIKVGMRAIDLEILNVWSTVKEHYPEASFERFLCDHIESLRTMKDIV